MKRLITVEVYLPPLYEITVQKHDPINLTLYPNAGDELSVEGKITGVGP